MQSTSIDRASAGAQPSSGRANLGPEVAAALWLAAGRPVALAIVTETWGSAPVPAGGFMAIAADDAFQGSVSGGCIEVDVIAAASETLTSGKLQRLEFGITDETAWRVGLACGGRLAIAIIRLDPVNGSDLFQRIATARESRVPIVVGWNVADGSFRLYDNASNPSKDVRQALHDGRSRMTGPAGAEIFLQAFTVPVRIVIAGATHIGQYLHRLAEDAGYEAIIVDPRAAFTGPQRFDPASVRDDWPEIAFRDISIDAFTAVVALTHISIIDDEALSLALKSPSRYIGALGSRKTHAKRLERLRAAQFSDDELARISAPIGLDIGAKTAGEIAVSILAEIIATFRLPAKP